MAGASLGSLIWAGCASYEGNRMSQSGSTIVTDQAIASAPVDQTLLRPDTHPELRSGLWQFRYGAGNGGLTGYTAVEAPTVSLETSGANSSVDTTSLLRHNQEVINIAEAQGPATGLVVTEAAGSAVSEAAGADLSTAPNSQELEAYRQELERKLRDSMKNQNQDSGLNK